MAVYSYDETRIKNEDFIIRRVDPVQHVVPDENTGGQRTSTKLFSPSSTPSFGMSVDIPKLMEEANVDAKKFVTTPVYTGSVRFKAQAARAVGLRIGYDPIKDVPGVEDNPYHGEVWAASSEKPNKFSRGQKKALVEASEWFVELPGVQIKV
ncbi:hypothetical protein [Acidiferrobacter sp.]|jgi:hypothetical protein